MVWLQKQPLTRGGRRSFAGTGSATIDPVSDVAPQGEHASSALAVFARSASKPSEALARLYALIERPEYCPGTRLPSERVLAAQLEVGRPALREAIKVLTFLEILESHRGKGTFVKAKEPAANRRPAAADLTGEDFGMLELLEVRKMFEPRATWLAATRGTESDLRAIEAARCALDASGEDWRRIGELDAELHSAIVRAAHNPLLTHIQEILAPVVLKHWLTTARSSPDCSAMHRDHLAITQAILRREPDAAEQAMLEHLGAFGFDLLSAARC